MINLFVFLTALILGLGSCREPAAQLLPSIPQEATTQDTAMEAIPVSGNSFVTSDHASGALVTRQEGLANWTGLDVVISTYAYIKSTGTLSVSLRGNVAAGTSVVKVTINGVSKRVTLSGSSMGDHYVGDFDVPTVGYIKIDLQGVSKTGPYIGDVSHVVLGGEAVSSGAIYSNQADYYYWSRRGPSCHLAYDVPSDENPTYYYNELVVPEGEDKIGSYFMSIGFSQGYFGIQVNSATERRILFSVWSPYSTDDPSSIPEDQRILLNRKGEGVHVGEFGNEGSGGQSYLKYNWMAGTTYRFLLKGVPDGAGNTDFTAWFYMPETTSWQLIASFKRPKTNTHLTGFHSFLENFSPNNGYLGRQVTFKNQWYYSGSWKAIGAARFTVDATYRNNQRIDAIGGVNEDGYFLKNGGFFSDTVAPNTRFTFQQKGGAPQIPFNTLP